MSKIVIKHRGLKEGKFRYKFEIKDSFFENFPEGEIKHGNIFVNIELIVLKNILQFNFDLSGNVKLKCDRCLDDFMYNINYTAILYAELGEKDSDLSDADNKITVNKNKNEIVLDKHIFDYIHLSIPYKRVHPEDENGVSYCNKEMLEKIENYETLQEQTETKTDPRWDKLKSLYN